MKTERPRNRWKATRNIRREARQEEILKVATLTMNELGYSRASMAEIARRLGLTYNALYHYFDSKEEILSACFLRGSRLLRARIDAAVQTEGSGLERLLCFVDEFMALVEEEVLPASNLILNLSPRYLEDFAKRSEADQATLAGIVASGIEDGSIARCDPMLAVSFTLSGLINFPFYRYEAPDTIKDGVIAFFERAHARR